MCPRAGLLVVALALAVGSACTFGDLDGLSGPPLGDAGDALVEGGDAMAIDAANDQGATSPYAAAVLSDQPVAYFRLDDGTLEAATNAVGMAVGTYVGETTILGRPGLIVGDPDTAVRLAGKGHVALPPIAGLFSDLSPYTVEAWIAVDAGQTSPVWILGWDDVNTPRSGVSFIVDSGGVAVERWLSGSADRAGGMAPSTSAASHVVTTFDGTKMQVWVDGNAGGIATTHKSIPAMPYPITVGAQSSGFGGYLHGIVDEVALYDRALSSDRILAHYHLGSGH